MLSQIRHLQLSNINPLAHILGTNALISVVARCLQLKCINIKIKMLYISNNFYLKTNSMIVKYYEIFVYLKMFSYL